ncbi:hypothetical protein ABPG72_021647 [Tetrahymena utriculariae]
MSQQSGRNTANSKTVLKKPSTSEKSSKLQINSVPTSQEKINSTQSTSLNNFKLPPTNNQNSKNVVLIQNVAGDGLWCTVKEDKYAQQAERFVEKKTKQVESKIESELVNTLEKQCSELGKELEVEKIKVQNKNIEIVQIKKIIDQQSVQLQEQSTEIMHLRNSKKNLEEQLEKTRDGFNQLKRDMNRVQSDSTSESQKSSDLKNIYLELKKQFEEYKFVMKQRIDETEQKLEETLEENEDLRRDLQIKSEISQRIDLERLKIFEQKEQQSVNENEKRIEKLTKLLEENAILSEKLSESETYKKKFKEKNIQLEKSLKEIQQQRDKIEQAYVQTKKRVNDLSVLKTTNNKILEEKIKSLSKENEDLIEENKKLKKQLQRKPAVVQDYEEEEQEELEEVSAKPFLFGPIDNGKF